MKDQCYSLLDDLSQALLHSSAPCWQIYPNQQSCEETKVLKKERRLYVDIISSNIATEVELHASHRY